MRFSLKNANAQEWICYYLIKTINMSLAIIKASGERITVEKVDSNLWQDIKTKTLYFFGELKFL